MTVDAYTVRGMTCGSCTAEVMELVRQLPGVSGVTVGYSRQGASPLLIESRAPVRPDELRQALATGGFDVAGSSARRARRLVRRLQGTLP